MELQFDPYGVLGISSNSTENDIKRAYRRLARRLHPDVNPNNEAAAAQFQDITWAYNILTDPIGKEQVDKYLEELTESENTYFTLRVTPSKRSVAVMPEEQIIYLLTEIYAAPQQHVKSKKHATLNLTLVLDQSNSMTGDRINQVKSAAQRVIDALEPSDILSVVAFNDRANVLIPAMRAEDKPQLKARISIMNASAGTEIYQGLSLGIEQNRKFLGPNLVNHVLLLTDGHTYGDQENCLKIAQEGSKEGITVSAVGLGKDWNDEFLDKLASFSGGSTTYIESAADIIPFFNEHVRSLTDSFSEHMAFSVAPDPDVNLEMAFKLSPNPQPLEVVNGRLPLGSLEAKRPIVVLLQFQMPAHMDVGFRTVARLVATGDILQNTPQSFQAVSDVSIEVAHNPPPDDAPQVVMDALSKLTLYRMQEQAQSDLDNGDIDMATQRLEYLATRLMEQGYPALATTTLSEATQLKQTSKLSERGRKTLKYSTRALVSIDDLSQAISSLMDDDI